MHIACHRLRDSVHVVYIHFYKLKRGSWKQTWNCPLFYLFIEADKVAGWMYLSCLKVVTWILVSDTETSCSQFWNLDWLSTLLTCFRIILHSKLPIIKSAPLLLLHVEILGATDQPCWNGISKEVSMVLRIGIVLDYITRISTMFARRAGIC